jgi:hypothetical protein
MDCYQYQEKLNFYKDTYNHLQCINDRYVRLLHDCEMSAQRRISELEDTIYELKKNSR